MDSEVTRIADKQLISDDEANELFEFVMNSTLVECRKVKNYVLELRGEHIEQI